MYKRILVPIDNSAHSGMAIESAIELAKAFAASVTGMHVYAARLHDARFRQMEQGLPARYHQEGELEKQRGIHNSLIGEGLKTISNSYLDSFRNICTEAGITSQCRVTEGRNYLEIIREANDGAYDLVVMGSLGLGAVEASLIGSVCERVSRKVRADVLVLKATGAVTGKIVVATDGSRHAAGAVEAALALSRGLGTQSEAISAFDPHFHTRAFRSIAGVLSDEASKSFRFADQEKLHDEIINGGLAKIYQSHLEKARVAASREGQDIGSMLLTGKPFEEILKYVASEKPSLLVLGRFGSHQTDGLDMGSTTENLLRLAPCNVLIVNREPSAQG